MKIGMETPEKIQPPAQVVRVVLLEDQDPKVYDAKTGGDVSRHCRTITICPAQEAFAEMLHVDESGRHFLDPETQEPALYRARVLSIRAEGAWSARERGDE